MHWQNLKLLFSLFFLGSWTSCVYLCTSWPNFILGEDYSQWIIKEWFWQLQVCTNEKYNWGKAYCVAKMNGRIAFYLHNQLQYCIQLWGPQQKIDMKLEQVQENDQRAETCFLRRKAESWSCPPWRRESSEETFL